jgi:hypothetical protein
VGLLQQKKKKKKKKCPSPMCICGEEEQTSFHLLTNCEIVDTGIREDLVLRMLRWNDVEIETDLISDCVTALNCSRDPKFISQCVEVIQTKELHLRKKITLSKKWSTQPL